MYFVCILADFETWLKRLYTSYYKSRGIIGVHLPLSFAFAYVLGGNVSVKRFHCGEDSDLVFVQELLKLAKKHIKEMSAYRRVMKLTHKDWMDYIAAKVCGICGKKLEEYEPTDEIDLNEYYEVIVEPETLVYNPVKRYRAEERVRHHWHSQYNATGPKGQLFTHAKFISAAHSRCNLMLKSRRALVCLFHNLNFDLKMVISGCKKNNIKHFNIIAKSSENFLMLEIPGLVKFVDSYAHLPFSLSSLIDMLRQDNAVFNCTRQILPNLTDKQYSVLIQKQIMF
jgi:hypothetical protein